MDHATPQTPRMCAWWMSGKQAAYAAMFEESVLALLFPKAFVAAGAFYRHNASWTCNPSKGGGDGEQGENGGEDACWVGARAHARRAAARGVAGCPLFADSTAGGLAADCKLGCTEAARCGVEYPHIATQDPVGNDPFGGGPCPYHY